MAGASLLTLLDDIATVLDDVAVMSKVAAKKTAGVLGDDLALNAQQVTGVGAEREIPVVVAVAKGSLRNKCILVPAALVISAFAPWLIMPLLMLGGLYLSYEGAEKVIEKLFHSHEDKPSAEQKAKELANVDMVQYEKDKVKGAIRTDFILSAEIIVIALGTVQGDGNIIDQLIVVSFVAFIMTIGVYGIVAGIVKLDDLGFYLNRQSGGKGVKSVIGEGLIHFAPKLMKFLTFVGTLAMFLVGGGIVVHNIPMIHHGVESLLSNVHHIPAAVAVGGPILNGVIGLIAGCIIAGVMTVIHQVRGKGH
ncbi:DUF808 family protein [Vibrio sp. CAIM 722]|uniref:DUF808 family protein n=1 Tax=Vibrio eleionomae TaxID=2653505 RepID=A0A7X4LHM7_9VIBR|nr:DUF808 domain-containing protein [Vibrio eleionomae]MZI91910.1 DUF808 family protein [Vibrio eleionomae]